MERRKDLKRMLRDIEQEVYFTRSYTHYDRFADEVMAAMAAVPRHEFVPEGMQRFAYDNGPLPIGHGQTISQPYIVALMTQMLEVNGNSRVLEVGTGSGYQTAVLSQIVEQVYSIEIVEALAEISRERLQRMGYKNIEARCSDGYLGWPEHAPYDGIIVTAAADDIPQLLIDQLKPEGRLVIPARGGMMGQELLLVEKGADGEVAIESVLPVAFVPMVHAEQGGKGYADD